MAGPPGNGLFYLFCVPLALTGEFFCFFSDALSARVRRVVKAVHELNDVNYTGVRSRRLADSPLAFADRCLQHL